MSFCANCGEQLNGESFCPKCGAKNEDAVQLKTNTGKKKWTIIIPVIGVIVVLFVLFGGRGYKSLIKTYINAYIDGNFNKVASLMPSKEIEYDMEAWYMDRERYIEEFIQPDVEETSEWLLDKAGGKRSKIKWKITEIENCSENELAHLQSDWQDRGLNIKAAKDVEVEAYVETPDGTPTATLDFKIVKIGSSWYVWKKVIYD
jgi:hypothetical protein